jgi:hypothetical protein
MIPRKLVRPELFVGLGTRSMSRARMPKTTINKNGDSSTMKYDVGLTNQIRLNAKSQPER